MDALESPSAGDLKALPRWQRIINEVSADYAPLKPRHPPVHSGVSSGGITGTPTTEGLFAFTIRVRDFTGAADTESFSIRIGPPRPLVITNQSDALSPGTVGQFYCCGNLFADGGVPGYTWSLRTGQLPPGLSLTASPGRITGTPTTPGTFTFLVRVTDSRGTFAERTFSITIS